MSKISLPLFCLALILAGFTLSTEAHAQTPYFRTPPQLDISPTKPLPHLVAGQTYAVDIDCWPKGSQLSPITDNGLWHTTWTTSHAILISSQQATSSTIATGTLPSGALGASLIYSTDGTTQGETDNRDHGCKNTFLIRRQNTVFLIPFISLAKTYSAGVVADVFAAALTPLASIASLITGGPLAAAASSRITDFQNVESSFNTILGKLNSGFNYAKTVPLGVGRTTITTSESVTTVTVRPVKSLINDTVDNFSNVLRTLADSETAKVSESNPDSTCRQLLYNVGLDGITAPEDQAYILGYEGLKNLQTTDDLMHCFGRLVRVAAGVSAIWVGNDAMKVTPDMANDFYKACCATPTQLPFADIQPTLYNLLVSLGRYSRNGQPPSPANTQALSAFFASDATLIDNSFAQVFKSVSIPSGFSAIIDFLIEQGYYRFGCYAQSYRRILVTSEVRRQRLELAI